MSGLLGGHIFTCWPCLSVWRKLRKRSKKAVQPIETIGLYPLKWTSPRTHPARIWEYLHQIHQTWPCKCLNCSHFGDNHGRDTDSRQSSRQSPKITVQGENHGNHGDREFLIYIHPYISCYVIKLDFLPRLDPIDFDDKICFGVVQFTEYYLYSSAYIFSYMLVLWCLYFLLLWKYKWYMTLIIIIHRALSLMHELIFLNLNCCE